MPLTKKQQPWYRKLAQKAYNAEFGRDPVNTPPFEDWRREINLKHTHCYSTMEMKPTGDFDVLMLELAIMADDITNINYFSCAAERRIRYVIEKQFVPDLEYLLKEPISYSYIEGIANQAGFPLDFNDCPADLLVRVLQMVDTHIRRLAKKADVELIDLPSGYFRLGHKPAEAKAKWHHDHHHHVTHEKETATA